MMLVKIKPAVEGTRVVVPGSDTPLKAEGQKVPMNTYWRRRIKDESVVVVRNETKAPKAASKKKD